MKVRTIIRPVFLVISLITLGLTPISAQESGISGSLEGIQSMYGRVGTFDFSTPDAAAPEAQWIAIGIYALAFDTEADAEAAIEPLSDDGPVNSMVLQMGGATVEDVQVDLDAPHSAMQATAVEDGITATVLQLVVQDGSHLYLLFGWATEIDPAETLVTLVTTMLDAEPSDEPESFNADGTSTGGLWATLPSIEDVQAEAPELTEFEDEIAYPEPGS